MKHVLLLLLIVAGSLQATAQLPPCCMRPAAGMIALATEAAFISAHQPPLPFYYQSDKGQMITFNTEDAKTGRAWYLPSSAATNKVLIIFHEWWGLNDYIKREAQRLQDSLGNIDVYAVDLYDGQIAATPEEASKLASSLDATRTDAIIKGVLLRIGRNSAIATLGWCLGGGYAFRASVLAGNQAAGCVMYYGFPEADGRRVKPLQTDVLYIWGSKDAFITRDKVAALQTAVKNNGHKFQWETYNAVHAFANPSNPAYDAAAAGDAMNKSLAFLRRYLALE